MPPDAPDEGLFPIHPGILKLGMNSPLKATILSLDHLSLMLIGHLTSWELNTVKILIE